MILNKLRKNSGITIIHALVSVLIFAVFSAIIFSATSTNMKSYSSQKDYQQAYLSVSNAAQLFIDSIDGDFILYLKEGDINTDGEYVGKITESYRYKNKSGTIAGLFDVDTTNTSKYGEIMGDFYYPDKRNKVHTHTISTKFNNKFSTDVVVEILMDSNYTIHANFYLKNAIANNNYYMNVEIPINKETLNKPFKETIVAATKKANGTKNEEYRIYYDMSSVKITKGKVSYE